MLPACRSSGKGRATAGRPRKKLERFSSKPLCRLNNPAWVAELEAYFKQRRTDEWVDRFNQPGIPADPILNKPQMHQDPQALAQAMIVKVEQGVLSRFSRRPVDMTGQTPTTRQRLCTRAHQHR